MNHLLSQPLPCHSPWGVQRLGCLGEVLPQECASVLLPCSTGKPSLWQRVRCSSVCHPMSPRLVGYKLRLLLPSAALHTSIQNSCT